MKTKVVVLMVLCMFLAGAGARTARAMAHPPVSVPFYIPANKVPPGPFQVVLYRPFDAHEWSAQIARARLRGGDLVYVDGVGAFRVDFLRAQVAFRSATG